MQTSAVHAAPLFAVSRREDSQTYLSGEVYFRLAPETSTCYSNISHSLQFPPFTCSFLGNCSHLASFLALWLLCLPLQQSWSTGWRWYTSLRRNKLWLLAFFKVYITMTQQVYIKSFTDNSKSSSRSCS